MKTRVDNEYGDNSLSLIDAKDSACEEKARIAEAAAATLFKLNSIMKQMKDWRDDRAKLRRNVGRLKLALRAAERETNDTLRTDPLIEHHREEIKRLEIANDALKREVSDIKTALTATGEDIARGNAWKVDDRLTGIKREFLTDGEHLNTEILYSRGRLNESRAKEKEGEDEKEMRREFALEHLRCKLKQFVMGDQTMEMVIADIVAKVAETVANLSEELVNVSEHLHKSRVKNDRLDAQVDKLSAALRSRSRRTVDYQNRVRELDHLTQGLQKEVRKFQANFGNKSWKKSPEYRHSLNAAERLAMDLKNKLRNDREALLAVDDSDCIEYMKKIIDLRVSLKFLASVELEKPCLKIWPRSRENSVESTEYPKRISMVDGTLKQIGDEIGKLKLRRLGGKQLGQRYSRKIEELETLVGRAEVTIKSFEPWTGRNSNVEGNYEKLTEVVRKVCHEIKELEAIVATSDNNASDNGDEGKNNCWSLLDRIEQLEESVVGLKLQLTEKENSLRKATSAKASLEQKVMELRNMQREVSLLATENKSFKERMGRMDKEILELLREHGGSAKGLAGLQQVRHETNVIRQKLQNLQVDKQALLKEMEKMRNVLLERDTEIGAVVTDRDRTRATLGAEIETLNDQLRIALEDNERLQKETEELKAALHKDESGTMRNLGKESSADATSVQELKATATNVEPRGPLKMNLVRESEKHLVHREIDLTRSNHLSLDRSKSDTKIFYPKSRQESVARPLAVSKATLDEILEEKITKLAAQCKELEEQSANLKRENERLKVESTDLREKGELLKKCMESAKSERSVLEDQFNKYKSECNTLREATSFLETNSKDLSSALKSTREELAIAVDKIKGLELENSRLTDSLRDLTPKNAANEARVQVLLTEKDDQATRINELNDENAALKDQWSRAQAENEYSRDELNKSRIESDRIKSTIACLQDTLEMMRKDKEMLERTNAGLAEKLNEIQSEYAELDDRLKILQMRNDRLNEERCRKSRSNEGNYSAEDSHSRSDVATMRNEGYAAVGNGILSEHGDRSHAESANGKIGKNETKYTAEEDDDVKIKDGTTEGAMERLRAENEALKFELINLRTRNSKGTLQLSPTRDEFEKLWIELSTASGNENVISNRLGVMNFYHTQWANGFLTNRYPDDDEDITNASKRPARITTNEPERLGGNEMERSMKTIDRLRIQSAALKVEVNALRRYVVAAIAEREKERNDLRCALGELRALKNELPKLRDEKEALTTRLNATRMELDNLKSEKVALKDELFTLRKTKHRVVALQSEAIQNAID